MSRYLVLFTVAFGLCSFAARADEAAVTSFEGMVKSGNSYSHRLPHDYKFKLIPQEDGGWRIYVESPSKIKCTSPAYDCNDLARITPPLDGPTMRDIKGWQFTLQANRNNKDRSAAHSPLTRDFYYLVDHRDLDTLMDERRCRSTGRGDCKKLRSFKAVKAVLHITSYKPPVASGAGSRQEYILPFIKFTVTVYPTATYMKR